MRLGEPQSRPGYGVMAHIKRDNISEQHISCIAWKDSR